LEAQRGLADSRRTGHQRDRTGLNPTIENTVYFADTKREQGEILRDDVGHRDWCRGRCRFQRIYLFECVPLSAT